jgi:hypothetical protein
MHGGRGDRHLLHQPLPEMWLASMFVVAGLVYLATGLVAWARPQNSRLGFLIVAGGWAWMLAALANIQTRPRT